MTVHLNKRLETGIAIIDEQHQAFFEMINKLNNFKEKETFLEALIQLQLYSSKHFETELEYMKYTEFPYIEEHLACHDEFLVNYKLILKKAENLQNITELAPELINFVEGWIRQHYTDQDVKLAAHLRQNSICSK